MLDLTKFESTSNLALTGEYRLTLEQFRALPASVKVLKSRKAIYELEATINTIDSEARIYEDTLVPVHRFTAGIYTRELTMPTGTIIVGKRHAQEHIVMMTEGFCTVVTERGWEDLHAPCTFTSPAGEKRVLFIHEKTTWITVHRTDATTPESAEDDLILTERPEEAINTIQLLGEN
jgi:hypothetical protein